MALPSSSYVAGRGAELRALVADSTPPDSVLLYLRPVASGSFRKFTMAAAGGYHYAAALPGEALAEGRYEFAITALRSLAYSRGVTIPASRLGKIKMGSQVTAILLLIVGWGPIPALAPLGYAALWVVMGAAIVSAVDYYRRFQRLVNARVTDVNIVRERRDSDRRTAHRT